MQLVHGGIWGHMAFGVTWRFSHPFAKVCPRSPPSAVRGGVLMVNVLNASKTFTQRKMFAVFFFKKWSWSPTVLVSLCQETAFPAAIVVALVQQHRATEDVLV